MRDRTDELREADIEALFPRGAAVAVAGRDDWEAAPCAAEAEYVAKAAEKRQQEFATGRACARRALARLGAEPVPIPVDPDRVPVWPAGFVGSISHTTGLCAAVVAGRSSFTSLGLDVEERTTLSEPVFERISTAEERAAIAGLAGDAGTWGAVLFSAKEAFYKCYYPIARTFLGFEDVRVTLEPDPGRFVVELVNGEKPPLEERRSFDGRFVRAASHVASGIALSPSR